MDKSSSVELTRRDLLRGGAAGLGLAAVTGFAPSLRATPRRGNGNVYIVVDLGGGNDGLNTVVPVGLSTYSTRRGRLALTTNQCRTMRVGPNAVDSHRLHPALSNMQALWARGELAVVHKVGFAGATLSHFRSRAMWAEGVGSFAPLGIPRSGWVARYADLHAPTMFGAVHVGNGPSAAFLGGKTELLSISQLSNYALRSDPAYWSNHIHRLNTVQRILSSKAPVLTGEPRQAIRQTHAMIPQVQAARSSYPGSTSYPATTIGRALSDIAVLMHGNFGTRIFHTGFEGFDTHARQATTAGRQAAMLRVLDDALGSFEADLRALGMWDRVVIAVASEFGRRNYPNASDGTDHGGAGVMMLCGGAVRGGLYGPRETDADLAAEALPYAVDFRSVHAEVLDKHLGVADPAPIFPERWDSAPVGGFV